MQRNVTARFLLAFCAGLLFGSALALFAFGAARAQAPLAVPLLGGGLVLLGALIMTRRRRYGAGAREIARAGPAARSRLGRVDDVVAIVAALEALRCGCIAQGDGS
jgi:hypothetical protein